MYDIFIEFKCNHFFSFNNNNEDTKKNYEY